MGLFGGKTTYVSSSVLNMAGEVADRPNYLKSLVLGNIIVDTGSSMADTLQSGYLNGPGIKLRSFGRWSQGDYADLIGSVTSSLNGSNNLDTVVLAEQIPHDPEEYVWIQRAFLGRADSDWWADKWMLENYPDDLGTAWESDYDESTGKLMLMTADGVVHLIEMPDYDPAAYYIYAAYTLSGEEILPGIPATTVYENAKMFIYKIGTGNSVLDAMFSTGSAEGFYLPPIPLRIDNKFVGPDKDQWNISGLPEDATEEQIDDAFKAQQDAIPVESLPINFPELYPIAKRALKKAVNGKFNSVTDSLAKNPSLKDIDYAYAFFGVCLNTEDESAKKYLWLFFNRLYQNQSAGNISQWQTQYDDYMVKNQAWLDWQEGGSIGPEPERSPLPTLDTANIQIKADGDYDLNFDIQIRWSAMAKTSGTGLAKPNATVGSVWWAVRPDLVFEETLFNPDTTYTGNRTLENIVLYKQLTDDSWEAISIWDMIHQNWIYNGKAVEITGKEALEDEDESGFIIPIEYQTYHDMPLVDATQMGTACCYLVLNSYKVVKQKWYQTGAFKIFLVVAIIAFSVATGGTGAGSIGLLGSNAAVGSALGLTGTLATIAGAVANAIVAMVVVKAIGYISVKAFGDKFGAIIGAIASLVALQVGTAFLNGGNISSIMGQLGKVDNILRMTSAVGGGVQGYIAASAKEIQQKTTDMMKDYDKKSDELDDLYAANIGSDRASFDPMALTGSSSVMYEPSETFLSRTLMTGSDVAEFSLNLISNFADITISTELP